MEFVPHNYQRICIDKVIENESLGLMLDMGLGKTIITLTAINILKFDYLEINKVLIIAPKKVAESTWTSETSKWDHLKYLRISKVLGGLNKRIVALNTLADIYIINRDNVAWLVEYYKNTWPFDMVVIDEFSSFKNHTSKRFKALKFIRNKINRLIGLTGTPAPNGMMDIWSQIYLLDMGERLGKNITAFRERYFDYVKFGSSGFGEYELKDGSEDSIKNKISDICISMKSEDYLELPDIIYDIVPVELDNKATKKYMDLERKMILSLDETEIDVTSAAALTGKLLQLANGAVYDENRNIFEVHNCKIERLLELIEQLNGKPVLIFYNFKHDLIRIKKALSNDERVIRELKNTEDEEDWNKGKINVLLAHPASTAYGLNLQQGGNHVVWFGLNWSLELYQQANKRLHRQGQKEKVIIHHLITQGTRDEDVMKALESKGNIQNELLESLKVRIKKYK